MNPLQFFKCLSDETRLRCILLVQHEKELCVCELTQALDEIQPKISRHLAQLRDCKLLTDRRDGQWVFYQINPSLAQWAEDILQDTLAANKDFLEANIVNLNRMGDRPQRSAICC